MKPTTYECAECKRDFEVTSRDIDEDGNLNLPVEQCHWCEGYYCPDRCYRAHECAGHIPEITICVMCDTEIEISLSKNHRILPALYDDDPVCAKCAYLRPWEKKKEPVHFQKAV